MSKTVKAWSEKPGSAKINLRFGFDGTLDNLQKSLLAKGVFGTQFNLYYKDGACSVIV